MWSRCIPFIGYDNSTTQEPIPDADVGFKSASWYPPVDRASDEDANNSWYFTLDYIALLSSQFLYYKGAMGFKIVVSQNVDDRPQTGYVYASLADPDNTVRQKTHVPWTYDPNQVPPDSNFGAGTVLTPIGVQPILECTIPYRGSNTWSYTNNNAYTRDPNMFQTPNASVNNNVVLLNTTNNQLADAMFRKIGPDFDLGVETILPPPTFWISRGFDWS